MKRCYQKRLVASGVLTMTLGLGSPLFGDSVEVGSFTKSTGATSQDVNHGLGESPKLVILCTAALQSATTTPTPDSILAIGASDGTNEFSISSAIHDGVGTTEAARRIASAALSMVFYDQSLLAEASITAWDSTSFTVDWTTDGAGPDIVHYIAIGGSGVSANVTNWTMPTSTGNHSVTGVGFEPTVVIHVTVGGHTAAPSSSSANAAIGLGVMTATGDQWANSFFSQDNVGTSVAGRSQRTDRCLLTTNSTPAISQAASFVSMDSDGFTVNFNNVSGASQVISISLAGLNAEAGSFDKVTSGSSQEVNGVLFSPDLLLLSSWQRTASTSAQVHSRLGFGAADGTSEFACGMQDQDSAGTAACDRFKRTDKVFGVLDNSTPSFDALADLSSFDDDGFTLNWSTNDATATEICYLALVPFSAVDARLSGLEALALASGVEVRWRTETEIDNLGFHVQRRRGSGAPTRVTERQIPGSALLATPGTALTGAQSYAWVDPDGQCGDQYWVEAYDLDGSTQLHGPVVAPSALPGQPSCSPAPVAGASSAALSQTANTPAVPRFADANSPIDPTTAAWIAARDALWIGVDREGWVRVGYDDWDAAGLPALASTKLLQLYFRGVEHAIEVEGDTDGVWGPGDSVCFYGLGLDTLETATAMYALTLGVSPGQRIRTGAPSSSVPALGSLPHRVVAAEETQYFAALRNGEADNFFGDLVTENSLTCDVSMPHHDTSSPMAISLEVSLQGIGSTEHDVAIAVNGVTVGTAAFSGVEHSTTQIDLLPPIASSTLAITLTTSGSDDFAFLDSIQVTYPRSLVMNDDFFRGHAPGSATLQLSEATPGTRVFDVTNPANVVELASSSVPNPGGLTEQITVSLPGGADRVWAAVPLSSSIEPTTLRANIPSRWRAQTIDEEFVIVAPTLWLDALKPLAQRRRREGLSTLLVAVEDLYDEWNGGATGSEPIAQFLRAAARPPRYLLLVGDTTYDPRERLPGTTPSVLPTHLIDSARLETASDQWFGDLDQDGVAEIAVGRLPAQSLGDVENYVTKVLAYAPSNSAVGSSNRALVVTDDDDNFPFGAAGSLAQSLLSQSMSVTRVDRNVWTVADARDQVEQALENGVSITAYFGHGGTGGWGAEDLLTTTQVQNLGNPSVSPVVISSSCLNGFFHHRLSETLGEAWLAGPEGAIAVWGSTSLSNPYPQRELSLALLDQLVGSGPVRLGDAFLAAQAAADPGTLRTTVLLGDPTVRFVP